jgi:hypothetical protein
VALLQRNAAVEHAGGDVLVDLVVDHDEGFAMSDDHVGLSLILGAGLDGRGRQYVIVIGLILLLDLYFGEPQYKQNTRRCQDTLYHN